MARRGTYRGRGNAGNAPGCIGGLAKLTAGLVALAVAATMAVWKGMVALATRIAHWDMRRQQGKGTLAAEVTTPPQSSWVKAWGVVGGVALVLVLVCSCIGALGSGGKSSALADTSPTSHSSQATNAPTVHGAATATATLKPTATATPTDVPLPPTDTPVPLNCNTAGAPCNPWGYTFANTGNLLRNPAGGFCNYFNCIKTFYDHTNGYVDECKDGTYSHSGGVTGDCSQHGGQLRPVYQP